MTQFARWLAVPAVFAGWLVAAAMASAATPGVKDNARPAFFKPETVEKANQVIREIHDNYGKELVIETFTSVPQSDHDRVTRMAREDREKYFSEWANRLAREQRVNGAFVLICRSPGHVEVAAGRETEKRDFLPANVRELRKVFFDRLTKNNYKPDEALLKAVEYVRDTLKAQHRGGPAVVKGPAGAATPGVKDTARPPFFKPETVEKANEIVREIRDRYGKDLIVETFSSVPPSDRAEVTKMSHEDREKYISEWANRLAREQRVNGIFVLICRSPGHVEVAVDRETEKKDFGPANVRELRSIFSDHISKNTYKPDEAMLKAVAYVRATLRTHHVNGPAAAKANPGGAPPGPVKPANPGVVG